MRSIVLICFTVCFLSLLPRSVSAEENPTIWYKTPAANWNTAFPIGNGRMGAMVFAIPLQDRIQLYERSGSQRSIDLRRGELNLTFSTHKNYKNYKRSLDLKSAVASMDYITSDGISCHREYMASIPDSVIIIRVTTTKKGTLSCNLSLKSPFIRYTVMDGQAMLILTGTTDQADAKGIKLRFVTLVKPWVTGGICGLDKGVYTIRKADEAVIYAASFSVPSTDKRTDNDLMESCYRTLARAYGKDYPTMRKKHEGLYQKLFNRVSLNLGRTAQADKPIDQRLKEQATLPDPSLMTLYVDYSRYLLLSNTFNATQLLPLQRLWSEQVFPAIESTPLDDWYRSVETWGLSPLREPLFQAARSKADAVAVAKSATPPLQGRGVDYVNSLWEHYLFTGDKTFLSDHFPFMQATARMYLDTLKVSASGSRQDIYTVFAQVIAATDVLHTGIKGLISPEKAFADTLKKRYQPVQTADFTSLSSKWLNEWKVGFIVDPSSRFDDYLAFPSRLAELLIQSRNGYIFVLPALPKAWKDGSVSGLKTKGGFEVSLTWKNSTLASLSIHSTLGGVCRIRSTAVLQGIGVKLAKGEAKNPLLGGGDEVANKEGAGAPLFDLPTESGKTYSLTVIK